jgi:hypothetical protein
LTGSAGGSSTDFGLQSGRCLVQCHHQESQDSERYLWSQRPFGLTRTSRCEPCAIMLSIGGPVSSAPGKLLYNNCVERHPECDASRVVRLRGGSWRHALATLRPCRWQGDRLCLRSRQIQYNALQAANVRKVMLHRSHNYGVPRAASLGRQIERNARHDQI